VVNLGFRGEVAEFYHRYRRGYPDAAIDALAGAFWLTGLDVVADLGVTNATWMAARTPACRLRPR
jgi:hypothetical protein